MYESTQCMTKINHATTILMLLTVFIFNDVNCKGSIQFLNVKITIAAVFVEPMARLTSGSAQMKGVEDVTLIH